MTIEIRARDLPDAIRKILDHEEERLRDAAYEACTRGVRRAVEVTEEAGVRDQGLYQLSWKAERTRDGADLRNDSPHAGVVELGRRPNRPGPPLEPILEWVTRQVSRGEMTLGPGDTVEAVARRIRLSIHRKGTPPKFVLRIVMKDMERYLDEAADRQLRRRGR